MSIRRLLVLPLIFSLGARVCRAADMSVELTTSDGSTKFSVQNSAASEVASIDSQGNASFATVTGALSGNAATATTAANLSGGASGSLPYQTGSGATTMLGAGINGQVIKQAGGVPTWANLSGSDVANVIHLQSTLQSGATFFVSSGTVSGPLIVGGQLTAGTGATPITTASGQLDATKLTGNLPALNGSALASLSAANITGNLPALNGSALTSLSAANITGNLPALNGSALTSLSAANITGNLPALNGSALTSLTGANVTGNIPGNAVSITGAIDAGQINTGTITDARLDSSSVTLQGNAFNAANALVKLDSSGTLPLPSGGSITIGSLRGMMVPSGTLILTTSTCPSGFTEYTGAGGYYLAGVPSGGTVAGTVGSAMTNQSNATHNHTISTTTANFVSTLGNTAAVTVVTSPTGDVARGTVAPYFQIRLCSVP